jgi:hypothetical protein
MSAYNLFRSKCCVTILCAVPEDRVVPGFVTGTHWSFAGRTEPGTSPAPSGFDGAAARAAARLNGFYLFRQVAESDIREESPSVLPNLVA